MLLQATKQGRIFMVNYLLDTKRVDINVTDKEGHTPLISACLLDDNMAATRRKLVRLFLAKNADVNLADKSGRNALIWACDLGKIDVVKILLGRSLGDLDFTIMDSTGNTALHYTSSKGNYTLTSMLVEAMKRFGVCIFL
jgi:ankyrin repeat protein